MEANGNRERYMGLALEIGFRVRKFVFVSIRTCYRSVRNYPFLFGLLCFLILLYRSCPFLFSLLVSASPVLICTAVLLGSLLSFGQPNIPEIETEENVSRDVASLRYGILDNATVVAKEDDSFTVERFDGNKVGNLYVEGGSEENRKSSKLDEHAGFVDFVPVFHEHDREIQFEKAKIEEFEKGEVEMFEKGEVGMFEKGEVEMFEKGEVEVFEKGEVEEFEKGEVEKAATAERELHSSGLEERREIFDSDFDIKSLATDGENAAESQLSVAQSMRNEILEVEDCNTLIEPVHKGVHLNLSHSDKDDHDENDYDSSGSESDRAESSSPDASMADIIPLLDELHPLLDLETPLPAHRSNEASDASSEQSHKSGGECVMSDDEAGNQGEEGGAVEHDDDEDDDEDEGMHEEKEDESKSAIKWTEDDQKNLMDLGSLELERNQRLENLIAKRRARNNLRMLAGKNLIDLDGFDLPVNVPPISTARRNPFDLPYDSYNNMGLPPIPGSAPSSLLLRRNPFDLPYDPNEEKPDLKSDDFEQEFLPPQHKDIFRRHESFSVGPSNFAIPKPGHQNIRWKPYFMPEKIAAEGTSYSPLERQFSEVSESKLSYVSDTESVSSIADQDDKKLDESQSFLETTAVSYLDPTTSSIEHGNGSWEGIGSEDYIQENRDVHHEVIEITLGSTESHFESQSGSSEIGAADTQLEINASEIHSKSVLVETNFSSSSSLSSLSEEVTETPFEVKAEELRPSSPCVEESGIETTSKSLPAALEEDADFKIASLDDNQHKEPVYDSSPSGKGKDSDVHSEIEQDVTSGLKDVHDASSEIQVVDKNEQESREVSEVIVHEVTKVESPKHDTSYDLHNLSVASELFVELVSVDTGPSSDIASIEKGIVEDIEEDKDRLTSHEEDNIDGIHKIEEDNIGSSPSSLTYPSELEQVEERSINEKEVVRSEQDFVQPSSVKSHTESEALQDLDIKIDSLGSSTPSVTPKVISSVLELKQSWSDKPMVETVINHREDAEEPGILWTDSTAEANSENIAPKVHPDISTDLSSAESDSSSSSSDHDFRSTYVGRDPKDCTVDQVVLENREEVSKHLDYLAEAYGSRFSEMMIREEVNEIEDIDEGLLLELDEVGDFSIKEVGEPVLEKKVMPEEAQAEGSELCSNSNSDIPILEARSLDDDINLAFRQLHDGVEVEDVILPSAIASQVKEEAKPETSFDLEIVEARSLEDIHVALMQGSENNIGESSSSFEPTETKSSDIPILEARSLDDINLSFRQLLEGVDVEDVILPSEIESQVNEEAKLEKSSDLVVVEARSLGDIHVALTQASENNIGESGSSSKLTETRSDIPILEAKSLDDINFAFRQLHEGVEVEDVILPSAVESGVREEAKHETSSDLEVVEARSLGDIHVALMQHSENNKGESGSTFNPTETKSDIPVLEARSLDDINLAFRQLHEGVDVEDVILPSAVENQAKEAAKAETSSDLEVVEAKSLGDIHVALMQVSDKNLSELPTSSVSNDPSKELDPAGVDSVIVIAPSNMTYVDKPADIIIGEKSVDPNVSATRTKDKKAKSEESESGSSSSTSSSDSE